MNELRKDLSPTVMSGRVEMRTPDEVPAMFASKACGLGRCRGTAGTGQPPQRDFNQTREGLGWRSAPVRSARPGRQFRAGAGEERPDPIDGVDDKIIGLYAAGLSVRDIQAHLEDLYGLRVSPDLISRGELSMCH